MSAIPKWTWTIDPVRRLYLCWLCVVLTACSSTQNPAPLQDPIKAAGVIRDVLGTEVSSSPGSLPSQVVRGNIALLLETQQMNDVTWYHVLGADGTHGWMTKSPGTPQETTAVAAVSPFSLARLSPDQANFNSSSDIQVGAGVVGQLVGGSRSSRPASTRDLMTPKRLSRSDAPWLKLRFGDVIGFAPLEWVNLTWPARQVSPGRIAAVLQRSGFTGIARRPFLGLVKEPLEAVLPRRDSRLPHCDSLDKPPDYEVATAEQYRPETTILAEGSQTQDALAEFGDSDVRLFSFINGASNNARTCVQDGDPYVTDFRRVDLNHDGAAEWMLEIVTVYGDGYDSALWVVNGGQPTGKLKIDQIALSHSSGEEHESPTEAGWWVDPDGRLWVIFAGARDTSQSFTYQGKMVPVRNTGESRGLVVFFDTASYEMAVQRRMKMDRAGDEAGIFPVRNADETHWVVARPFDRLTGAQEWANKHSLAPTAVRRLRAAK
jgi:hypothetical protein